MTVDPMNLTNVSDFAGLITYANNASDGWMFIALLCGTFVIALASFIRFGKTEAMISASFLSVLLAFVLSQAGLLDYAWLLVSFLTLLVSIIAHGITRR